MSHFSLTDLTAMSSVTFCFHGFYGYATIYSPSPRPWAADGTDPDILTI